MRTIAIINQKGGCGKTTTSINLAACLARLGQKTLLVDMDPQGHCAIGLAVPEKQIERTIYEVLIEESDGKPARVADVVWQIATDFDLAPSNIKLAAFEQVFAGREGRDDRLRKALQPVQDTYKWCIVDCPPSVGLITFNALRACDECIVPVETGYFSLHGLARMMETLEVLREKCAKEILIRVLPTLYDTRTKLAREVLSELRAKFKEYLMESTVNFNTKLKEAASFGQPITEYDPGSRGYKDFVNLARELMGYHPAELEPTPVERLTRPQELVQRAKQLAQLTNIQFGRHAMTTNTAPPAAVVPAEPVPPQPVAATPVPTVVPTTEWLTIGGDGRDHFGRLGEMAAMALEAIGQVPPVNGQPQPLQPTPPIQPIKTTEQKIEEFYGVKQVNDEVIFAARFDEAKKVLLAGDFNNWSPMSTPLMNSDKPGQWITKLPLPPGRYRYRFVVDGKWMTDPYNRHVETNQFGELNNVVEVD